MPRATAAPPPAGPTSELTPEQAIERILRASYRTGFSLPSARLMDMFGLPLATDPASNLVRTAYRRACLKIHPDKCRLPRAEEAFKALDALYRNVVPLA